MYSFVCVRFFVVYLVTWVYLLLVKVAVSRVHKFGFIVALASSEIKKKRHESYALASSSTPSVKLAFTLVRMAGVHANGNVYQVTSSQ